MARILYSRTVTITLKMSFFEALYGHDRHLVISIVEMLDWRDFSSLLEADKGLARLMKDENITEINKQFSFHKFATSFNSLEMPRLEARRLRNIPPPAGRIIFTLQDTSTYTPTLI